MVLQNSRFINSIVQEIFSSASKYQSRAKHIGNLLGFPEKLDLKRKFKVAFWLFSTTFLARRLSTRMLFKYLISFHPNSFV